MGCINFLVLKNIKFYLSLHRCWLANRYFQYLLFLFQISSHLDEFGKQKLDGIAGIAIFIVYSKLPLGNLLWSVSSNKLLLLATEFVDFKAMLRNGDVFPSQKTFGHWCSYATATDKGPYLEKKAMGCKGAVREILMSCQSAFCRVDSLDPQSYGSRKDECSKYCNRCQWVSYFAANCIIWN